MRVQAAVVVAGIASLVAAASAHASTYRVNGFDDSTGGTCSGTNPIVCTNLRLALTEAQRATGADTVQLPAGTYYVTQGQLPIVNSQVTVVGASAATTTIQGDGKSARIFNITGTAPVTVSHLKLTGGASASQTDGSAGGDVQVGSGSVVTLDHVQLTGGVATRGGGLAIQSAATVTITYSLINGNQATGTPGAGSAYGGGIYMAGDAKLAGNVLNISDSTIFNNQASQYAGIYLTGNAADTTTLTRVTLAGNHSSGNPAGLGVSDGSKVSAGGSIFINTGDGANANCSTKLTSLGGNIDSGSTCGFGASDKSNTDPQLSTVLSTAGGETQVLSIPATSPAVDFAGACSGFDQRGLDRPQGAACDSGAYEFDQAPDTTLRSGPSGTVTSTTAVFTFVASDAGSTFLCSLDGAAYAACSSGVSYSGLKDGGHTFGVQAVDPAGNVDTTPATRTWTVDTGPPVTQIVSGPSGTTTDQSVTFSFQSSKPGSTFECSLDGAPFAPCGSTVTFDNLAPGAHTLAVRARDSAGTVDPAPPTRSFTIAAVQPASTPTPTPTATPTPTPAPTPTFHQTVVVQPSGTVLVKIKPSTVFVPLSSVKAIPLGSEVDVRHGQVRLFSVPKDGAPAQSALFYGGIFRVTQSGAITQLALTQALSCPSAKQASAAASKPKTRKLWGDGSGNFRTRGHYSAATVRGTKWLVQDGCTSTLTRVARGVVQVQDLVKHRTKILRAGQSYTARKG